MFRPELEQTLADCLARPLYCSSLGELVRLANHIGQKPDPRFVIAAAMRWDSFPVLHRLGMFAELLKSHWPELYADVADTVRPALSPKSQAWPLQGLLDDPAEPNTDRLAHLRRSWRIHFCEQNKQL
jgi:hypothetical protein